jgi:hypothetical protein
VEARFGTIVNAAPAEAIACREYQRLLIRGNPEL